MIYLIGSIVLSSFLTLAFKMLGKLNIPIFQSIVYNYLICVVTGSIVNQSFPINQEALSQTWFHWACVMGVLFIILFNMIGITAQKISVAVASVANKLSLIIPVILSVYLYNESVKGFKLLGVIIALVAVVFTCLQDKKQEATMDKSMVKWEYALPFLLFIGSGLLDSLINHVQQKHVNESNSNAFLISGFAAAGTIGLLVLLFQFIQGKQQFSYKPIVAGIIIGIPNYFSIWCLVRYLKFSPWQSSASIPINNMGIVLFSTIVAWIAFKEKLSKINWIGIGLSIIAIYLIAFGDSL
ncbi:MAG: EamA family transporter [Chitinophagaceae bacterium]